MSGELVFRGGGSTTTASGTLTSFPIYQAGDGFTSAINLGTGGVSKLTYHRIGPIALINYIGEVGTGASLGAAMWLWKTNTVAGNTLPFTVPMPGTDVDAFGQNSSVGQGYVNDATFGTAAERFWPCSVSLADLSGAGITTACFGMATTVESMDQTAGANNVGASHPYGGAPAAGTVICWSIVVPVV